MLEKIDQIVMRLDVTYEEAKEALDINNQDVVEAIIYLEKKHKGSFKDLNEKGTQMVEKLKDVLKKGNVTKVILEKDSDVILNLPVTIGAIGLVIAPIAAIIGVSAAVVNKYKIKIVKNDGSTIDLNEEAEDRINEIKEKVNSMMSKENKDITDEVIKESKEESFKDLDK